MEVDDDVLLEAFLAVVKEDPAASALIFETGDAGLSESTSFMKNEGQEVVQRSAKKPRTCQLKSELETLRASAQALEEQLQELRRLRGPNHRGSQRIELLLGATSRKSRRLRATGSSVWRDLAIRQYQQLERGKLLNHRLRDAVRDHSRVIEELQRLARHRQRAVALTSPSSTFHCLNCWDLRSNPQLHKTLTQLAEDLHQVLRMHLRGQRLQSPPSVFQSLKLSEFSKVQYTEELQRRTKNVIMTLSGGFVASIPCHELSKTVWRHYGCGDVKMGHSDLMLGTLVDAQGQGADIMTQHGRFQCTRVIQRYNEGDCEIIVIKGRMQPCESNARYIATSFEEWFILQPVEETVMLERPVNRVMYSQVSTITVDSTIPHAAVNSIVKFFIEWTQKEVRNLQGEIDQAMLASWAT
ncbi:hypothetical protein Poli38472_009135 [Pythium oligandrum]|uniref:Uncharacterized protein n=1 Tax=Pythium oligandrum TaxID=41045 RepID=A0A8K1CL50_PYTOL|nr:hypothetical protein Poli38472_009135 [Pythium oligandrum]|eukprot:TMW64968.1 hypothetical protein Poli38472_009135 [Pythium oligandrum]